MITAQSISAFGDAFASVAMPLLVLQATGQVWLMGVTVSVSIATRFSTGFVVGGIVDRFDRRRLVIVTEVADFVLAGSIPLVWFLLGVERWREVAIVQVLVVVVLSSFVSTVHDVSLRALMPALAGRDRLLTVNARVTTITEITYGVGPAIAGLVIATIGEELAIGINAVSFILSASLFLLLRLPPAAAAQAGVPDSVQAERRGRAVGLRYLWGHPFLRPLLALEMVNALLVAGVVTLFIYYLRTGLSAGSVGVGVVLSVASIGALAASLAVGPLRRRIGFGRVWLAGVAIEGLALVAVAVHQSLAMLAVLSIVFAVGNVACAIVGSTVRQLGTPDRLLGRVTAAAMTVILAAEAIGNLAVSGSAEALPTVTVFVLVGVGCLVLAGVGALTPLGRRGPADDATLDDVADPDLAVVGSETLR